MAIQKQSYQIMGMRQDNLVGTNSSNKFAHEIMNLRLNTVGDYTTAAWTTEEGTKLKPVQWVDAPSEALALLSNNPYNIIPIGQAIINDQWIVFTTQTPDSESPRQGVDIIFKYWYEEGSDQLFGTILYAGNLNMDGKHPCETLAFYENEHVQKVYWTDGKNQPRVINIVGVKYHTDLDGQFDFVQEVALKENVVITKRTDGAGLFPPGTVKYAITYYKKYGQETNVVYDSPLYYPIKGDRACSPDELSGDSFEIKVTNIDDSHGFDYIRLYSIVRTTEDATPIVRIVADKELASLPSDPTLNPNHNKYALFLDTNTTGEIVDPTILQYVGGNEIVVQTFDQKNNTLFLGNVELTQKSAKEALEGESLNADNAGFVRGDWHTTANAFDGGGYGSQYLDKTYFAYDNEKAIGIRVNASGQDSAFYQHSNQMTASKHWHSYATSDGAKTMREHNGNSRKIKIFKYGEYYRFGIQFQDTKGSWSEVLYLKDAQNTLKPVTDEYSSVGVFGVFKYTLPNAAVQKLVANNYVKARLVCCYPNNTDRTIIAQGVINPTMYNNFWKSSHAPDYFSSWFFRPVDDGYYGGNINSLQFKQGASLPASNEANCEIQSMRYLNDGVFKQYFFTNQNLQTLHSPEITFDESIRTLSLNKVDIRAVGYVPVNSWSAAVYVDATSPFPDYYGNRGPGLQAAADTMGLNTSSLRTGSHFVNQGEWKDRDYYAWTMASLGGKIAYPLYPFHRKGSLANYIKDMNPWYICIPEESVWYDPSSWDEAAVQEYYVREGAMLQSKVLSHLLYSATTVYRDNFESLSVSHDMNKYDMRLSIFDSKEIIPEKVDDGLIYYGNLNSIAPICDDLVRRDVRSKDSDVKMISAGAYPLYAWRTRTDGTIDHLDDDYYASDPVPITFKSTAHGVFSTDFGTHDTRNYLTLGGSEISPYLYLVDVCKKVDDETRFGGRNASTQNIYVPCGPVVDLRECATTSPILLGLEGDHYFMRYDCLKTFPRALDDTNQIVEILSFMTETRVNLDGRYDKNRGLSDNTAITDTNFNLINQSYTQSNNFFSYSTLDDDSSTLNKFANLITWTKGKVSGEDVDTWTNITLASTADAEGVCGAINKIINVNDTLYSFQDHGIAQIGYNEKTALTTTDGVPLEISNSGKFSGLKYLTKEIGCQNKWSISLSKNGAFFIDDSRQELLALGEGLDSLSTMHGLDAFLIQQLPSSEDSCPWTPFNPNNFVAYYDKLGNDVLYINKDYCLAWNEQSKTFTSFYSYNDVPLMANIGTHLLMWDIHTPLTFELDSYEVEEEETTYTPVITTSTGEIEHVVQTEVGEGSGSSLFNDDKYLVMKVYHYDRSQESSVPPDSGSFSHVPKIRWIANDADTIRESWVRMVTHSGIGNALSTYSWAAHFILSLEFRKNGQPFVIQFEVEGNHYKTGSGNRWVTDPAPILRVRTQNVTDEEFEIIRNSLFLGGTNAPTFNIGCKYVGENYMKIYDEAEGIVEPWNNIDSSFTEVVDGVSRHLICVVKLYDLTRDEHGNDSDHITDWEWQGNPFRLTSQWDPVMADITGEDYDESELRYQTATTTETTEDKTVVWEPMVTTKTVTRYLVKGSSSNIWAARENPNHCEFFGAYKPYWMTLVCDGASGENYAFPADKVFNVIEYRADVFNRRSTTPRPDINLPVFDKIAAYNGYQIYKEFPINSIRKFEIWRAQLPRATYMDSNHNLYTNRDRIRNPFCYIKLMNTVPETLTGSNRMILHDLAVYYDMK